MRRILRAQLEEVGLDPAAIDDVRGCTCCDRERFFSYRRDGQRSGRLLSAIVARGSRE
jgi:copper oxidase (laccase) domain-containing protein